MAGILISSISAILLMLYSKTGSETKLFEFQISSDHFKLFIKLNKAFLAHVETLPQQGRKI